MFVKLHRWPIISLPALLLLLAGFMCAPLCAGESHAGAQRGLPAPEKIVADYLKAVGGRKRVAGIRDATYEYDLLLKDQKVGSARKQLKASTFERTDTTLENEETMSGSNGRSAWRRATGGQLNTLTDAEGNAAKLQATLDASRLLDYKKLDVLARTVGLEETTGEPAYQLEFSARNGARLRYWFSASSHLLLKVFDETSRVETTFGDYRAEGGLVEPHRLRVRGKDGEVILLVLQKVGYNTGLGANIFDPPTGAEALDIPALLRELERNQKKIDERVAEYYFVEKRIERDINARGEVTKEKTSVYEVYPLIESRPIHKLISEDGVPLSPERAAKRDKEIAEFVEKYEHEREKKVQKREAEKSRGETEKKRETEEDNLGISVFLRVCEFVSARRERRGTREAVVFDFRARPGFHPKTQAESIVSKLVGIVWIDPVDKEVMRLEARLAEGYKVGGGLVASISPGSAFAFEQVRLPDGVWLPRFAQVNFKAKVLLFKGLEANETREYSEYKRFNAETTGYQLDAPKTEPPSLPVKPRP